MTGHPLTGLFYCVQFSRDLLKAIDWIVDVLIPSGKFGETSTQLASKIDATLATGESLTHLDMSERNLSDETLREFLRELRKRLPQSDLSGADDPDRGRWGR